MEKHHHPHVLMDTQARVMGWGRASWGTLSQSYLCGRDPRAPSYVGRWSLEGTEEWKIRTTLTTDIELTSAIKCHSRGGGGGGSGGGRGGGGGKQIQGN